MASSSALAVHLPGVYVAPSSSQAQVGAISGLLAPAPLAIHPRSQALRRDDDDDADDDEHDLSPPAPSIVCVGAGIMPSELGLDGKQMTAYVVPVHGRYTPNDGDGVVGVVVDRYAEEVKVSLGPHAAFPGVLSLLAFEGATRRNRPRINVGDVVYAVVKDAGRYEECSLACMHEADGKAHGLGVLAGQAVADGGDKGGNASTSAVIGVSLGLARALLDAPPFTKTTGASGVLRAIGKRVPFEVTVGANGRVWIAAESHATVSAVAQAITACEGVAASRRVDVALEILSSVISV
ncbi:exosome complex component RRP40 [Pseudoscourfieldia marina]